MNRNVTLTDGHLIECYILRRAGDGQLFRSVEFEDGRREAVVAYLTRYAVIPREVLDASKAVVEAAALSKPALSGDDSAGLITALAEYRRVGGRRR